MRYALALCVALLGCSSKDAGNKSESGDPSPTKPIDAATESMPEEVRAIADEAVAFTTEYIKVAGEATPQSCSEVAARLGELITSERGWKVAQDLNRVAPRLRAEVEKQLDQVRAAHRAEQSLARGCLPAENFPFQYVFSGEEMRAEIAKETAVITIDDKLLAELAKEAVEIAGRNASLLSNADSEKCVEQAKALYLHNRMVAHRSMRLRLLINRLDEEQRVAFEGLFREKFDKAYPNLDEKNAVKKAGAACGESLDFGFAITTLRSSK